MRKKRKIERSQETSVRSGRSLEDYLFLASRIAALTASPVLSFEERQQAALLGMSQALESLNESRSSALNWLFLKGFYAVKDAIRRESLNLSKLQSVDPDSLVTLPSASRSPLEELIQKEEQARIDARTELVMKSLRKLEPRVRYIVRSIALEGKRQQTVAKEMKISQSWCSRLYAAGLAKIRENVASVET